MTRNWTHQDLLYLEAHYLRQSVAQIGKHLGRSVKAVETKAYLLGLTHQNCWSAQDKRVLLAQYVNTRRKNAKQIAQQLGRTTEAVYRMATRLRRSAA